QSETDQQQRLIWFDRMGKRLGIIGEPADYSGPRFSPDGKQLAVAIRDPLTRKRDIWLIDLARGGRTRFTSDPEEDFNTAWSKDGSRIFFTSDRKGQRDLFQKKVNATGDGEIIYTSPEQEGLEDVSPDGRWIIYLVTDNGPPSLWMLPLEGERNPR